VKECEGNIFNPAKLFNMKENADTVNIMNSKRIILLKSST